MSVTFRPISISDLRLEGLEGAQEIPDCYVCEETLDRGAIVAHEGVANTRHPLHEKCLEQMVDHVWQRDLEARCGPCRGSVSNASNYLPLSEKFYQFMTTGRQRTRTGIALGLILPLGLSWIHSSVIRNESVGENWKVLVLAASCFYSGIFAYFMLTQKIAKLRPFVFTVSMVATAIGWRGRSLMNGIDVSMAPLTSAFLAWAAMGGVAKVRASFARAISTLR